MDQPGGTTPTEILINDWTQERTNSSYHHDQNQPLLAEHSNSSGTSDHHHRRPVSLTNDNNDSLVMGTMDNNKLKTKVSPGTSPTGENNHRNHMVRQTSTTTYGSGLDDDDLIDPERGLGIAVEVCGGNFSWSSEPNTTSLFDIMFNAEAGKNTENVSSTFS